MIMFPGDLLFDKRSQLLWVKCADTWVNVTSVFVPGRKRGPIEHFINGCRIPAQGSRFCQDSTMNT